MVCGLVVVVCGLLVVVVSFCCMMVCSYVFSIVLLCWFCSMELFVIVVVVAHGIPILHSYC